jgi:SpoVK/Ycf46/Vps4 family AAA+-type ATPase
MTNEIDDAREFVELTEKIIDSAKKERAAESSLGVPEGVTKSIRGHGRPTQYALYGEGYTATAPTIPSLPPNCYDICVDSKCIYAVPSLPRSGLLLELPEMRSDDVVRIVENFWNSEQDYKEGNEFIKGGARFSAGLLIYGDPGTGKSCTIQIVSNKLIERGGTVFFGSVNPCHIISFLTDFSKVERNRKSIVILEDIDSLIATYGEANYLEMLDSSKTIDNVLFIATTNYPELLDPRIYNRPGRLSHVIKIGLPTAKAREAYLRAILKNHKDIEYIVANTDGFTIDHITALVNGTYREKKELKSEIARLRTLFKVPKTHVKSIGISNEQKS